MRIGCGQAEPAREASRRPDEQRDDQRCGHDRPHAAPSCNPQQREDETAKRLSEQRTERYWREPSGSWCDDADDQDARQEEEQLRGNTKCERRRAGDRGKCNEVCAGGEKQTNEQNGPSRW